MRLLHPIALTWDSEKTVISILFTLCWHQFLSCEAIMKLCEIKLSGVNVFDFLCFERIVSLNVQRHIDFKLSMMFFVLVNIYVINCLGHVIVHLIEYHLRQGAFVVRVFCAHCVLEFGSVKLSCLCHNFVLVFGAVELLLGECFQEHVLVGVEIVVRLSSDLLLLN
jgi:hypothetical protein